MTMQTSGFDFHRGGFILLFCSNYSYEMHHCSARVMGQTDRQMDELWRLLMLQWGDNT